MATLPGCGVAMVTAMVLATLAGDAVGIPPPPGHENIPWEPKGPNSWHHTTTARPGAVVTINSTRYPGNLCRVCTTTRYPCVYAVSGPCRDIRVANTSTNSSTHSHHNVTSSPFSRNTTLPANQEYYDDWNDGTENSGRRKRFARWRGKYRRWNRAFNDRWNTHHKSPKPHDHHKDTVDTSRGRCTYNFTKTCVDSRCEMACCDGRPMGDGDNSCLNGSIHDTAIECMNGGRLSSHRTYCLCPTSYSGIRCQHRQCSVKCQNGGVCKTNTTMRPMEDTTHYDDYCVCPSGTKGKFCEIRVCTTTCQNNGTCYSHYFHDKCLCPKGFGGKFCEIVTKNGSCPPSSKRGCIYNKVGIECHRDHECPGQRKCCLSDCSLKCLLPFHENSTCTYKNVTYEQGTSFIPDRCRLCTCNASHVGAPRGVIECTRVACPDDPQHCTNVSIPADGCCPICNDDPNTVLCAGNYTVPYFSNCPDDMVTVDVGKKSNVAVVRLKLKAYDCTGRQLDVRLSADRLRAGVGEDNFQLMAATSARDGKGNFAECAFHVRIRDPYPPEFKLCPIDISMAAPGPVTWQLPVAKDNVGLSIPPTSRFQPGGNMGPGDHMVEYWAEDYQGNVARCSFIVTVGQAGGAHHGVAHHQSAGHHGSHDYSHGHSHAQPHNNSLSVGLAVTGILIVLLAGAVGFLLYRQRHQRKSGGARTSPQVTSGGQSPTPQPPPPSVMPRWNDPQPSYLQPPDPFMSPPDYSPTDGGLSGLDASGGYEAPELPSKTPEKE